MPHPKPVDLLFPDAQRPQAISERRCVNKPYGCGLPIQKFRDDASWREYNISGLCQRCQDKIFGE